MGGDPLAAHTNYRLGLVLVTASTLAWSTAGFFTRLIPLDSWTMLIWRGLFGALGISVVIFTIQGRKGFYEFVNLGVAGWLFAIVSALGMIFFITSFRHTSVAHVAVIYALVPFVTAALAWVVMRERPSQGALIASLVALLGVIVMVGFGPEGNWFGDLLALGMTSCMAAMMVIARRFQNIPTMPAAAVSALLSGAVSWPFGQPVALASHLLILLALFGLVNSAVGLALFTLGARMLPAIETALIGSLEAPLAPLWVWLAFDEQPSIGTLAGGLVVFAAVAVHIAVEADTPRQ